MNKKNTIKTAKYYALCIVHCALIPASCINTSCSSSDNATTDPSSPVELRLTSGIEVETRATQSTQIASGEMVKVWVEDATTSTAAYEANELTADGEGNLTGGTTMYFPQTGNNVNIYALHGNLTSTTKTGGSFTVTADQSTAAGTNYTNSDLLVACAEGVARNGNPTTQALTFYHMLSKLELQIAVGDGSPSLATSGAVTISDVITDGTLTADYSKDLSSQTNRAAMVSAGSTTNTMTLPQSTEENNSNEAIIVPQSMAGKVLTFTLANGGKLSYKFPEGTTFESGKKYIYKITLKLTELQVTSSVADWGEGDEKSGNAVMPPTAKDVSAIAVGDYYTSDGKLYSSTISSDELAVIQNKIIGVVFSVGKNSSDGEKYYKTDGTTQMTTINGFVVSLYDANDGDACAWKVSSRSSNTRGSSLTAIDNIYSGYALTKAITATDGFSESTYPAVYYAVNIDLSAPSNSTGWFVPSETLLTSAYSSETVKTSISNVSSQYVIGGKYWNASGSTTMCGKVSLGQGGAVVTNYVRPILVF